MPDRDVKTIRDLIYYQYAKIIAKSAFHEPDGQSAKKKHYGFIKETFRKMQNGQMSWSTITREDWQLVEAEKKCAYCGTEELLAKEHIVPKSLKIKPECAQCDAIQGIHNQVWACQGCNSRKGIKGLYQFFREKYPKGNYYDLIPELLEKKYLKTIIQCHECTGTLDQTGTKGELSVLSVDEVLSN
jgi:5-methylcytosine-specific restriction endonuclease McrA